MGMDQFVTTYRKDYLWPYVRTLGLKPEPEKLFKPQYRDDKILCECHCHKKPPPTTEQKNVFGPNATKEEAWSRLGPMGPLLDPKLYPAKVGTSPEVDTARFNQPNVFLKKLHEKYPFIYECLRNAPPDDLLSRINRDRLRTTYQVDYGHMTEFPSAPYDELIRAAGVEGMAPCSEPVRLPGDPCRPNQKPIAYRPAVISKSPQAPADKGGEGGCGRGIAAWNPFDKNKTEYDAKINKLGQMIYRDKLHAHGLRSAGRRRLH